MAGLFVPNMTPEQTFSQIADVIEAELALVTEGTA